MVTPQPRFLLISSAEAVTKADGRWHFVLESLDGSSTVEASDVEPGVRGERLDLLAVVRGLEALDQPSQVTLLTASRRIIRGFRTSLTEWRSNRWRWERDGRWELIKNADLWRRVDRALTFHQVICRSWRVDAPSEPHPLTSIRDDRWDSVEAEPTAITVAPARPNLWKQVRRRLSLACPRLSQQPENRPLVG